ncbi:MAG TPA: hypothetical protein VKA34_12140 [Balneolales bacterium]|nr:hypothetical protein [Balneolales bacterium]
MKSKHILIIGALLFLLAFIFPPYKYKPVTQKQSPSKDPVTKIAYRPIWNGTQIYDLKGNLIGKNATFYSLLWFGTLFVIGIGTRTIVRFRDI